MQVEFFGDLEREEMTKPKAFYLEVAELLIDEIKKGVYSVHQKLPSEYELAKKYDVSRLTIRKSIDHLAQLNYVVKQKNKGTYVMAETKIQSGGSGLVGFTEAAKLYGLKIKTKVIDLAVTQNYPDTVARALNLEENAPIYHIERIRYADDEPMTYENIYLDESVVNGLTKEEVEKSLFEAIEKSISIGYSHQEVEAVLIDEKISEVLKAPMPNPVFLVNSVTFSIDGYPILYDTSYYRADKYKFKNILYRNQ